MVKKWEQYGDFGQYVQSFNNRMNKLLKHNVQNGNYNQLIVWLNVPESGSSIFPPPEKGKSCEVVDMLIILIFADDFTKCT